MESSLSSTAEVNVNFNKSKPSTKPDVNNNDQLKFSPNKGYSISSTFKINSYMDEATVAMSNPSSIRSGYNVSTNVPSTSRIQVSSRENYTNTSDEVVDRQVRAKIASRNTSPLGSVNLAQAPSSTAATRANSRMSSREDEDSMYRSQEMSSGSNDGEGSRNSSRRVHIPRNVSSSVSHMNSLEAKLTDINEQVPSRNINPGYNKNIESDSKTQTHTQLGLNSRKNSDQNLRQLLSQSGVNDSPQYSNQTSGLTAKSNSNQNVSNADYSNPKSYHNTRPNFNSRQNSNEKENENLRACNKQQRSRVDDDDDDIQEVNMNISIRKISKSSNSRNSLNNNNNNNAPLISATNDNFEYQVNPLSREDRNSSMSKSSRPGSRSNSTINSRHNSQSLHSAWET